MEILIQFGWILLFCLAGEGLSALIPLPIPASIYGFLLLFLALCTKVIRLEKVEKAGDLLLAVMPALFIPAGVELMTQGAALKQMWLPIVIGICLVTPLVMAVTGVTSQAIITKGKGKEK